MVKRKTVFAWQIFMLFCGILFTLVGILPFIQAYYVGVAFTILLIVGIALIVVSVLLKNIIRGILG